MLLQTTQKFGFRFQRRDIEQTIEATSKMWFWQLKSFFFRVTHSNNYVWMSVCGCV